MSPAEKLSCNLKDANCVVLGAGGFVGTNLCRSLVGSVRSLRAFGRSQQFPEAMERCEWMRGDFTDPNCLSEALSGCDIVFHLVNASTPASANVDMIAELNHNVTNTLRFLDICLEAKVKRVVFVSSGGTVYGIPDQLPTPETAATNPITAYGISKLMIEKYLGLYEYLHGLEYQVLRVANPFGPYQLSVKNQGVIAAFLQRALTGKSIEVWGAGGIIRDYVYIDDVISALVLAAQYKGPDRIFNIGSGKGLSIRDIINEIQIQLDTEVCINQLPGRSVDVPVSTLDVGRAKRELGWQSHTQFENGLRKTIEWMRARDNVTNK